MLTKGAVCAYAGVAGLRRVSHHGRDDHLDRAGNGKLCDRIDVPANIAEDAAKERAQASERVRQHVEGKEIRKNIYVPGRLVNLVVG